MREGLALVDLGLSPYTGGVYHGPPLALALLSRIAADPLLSLVPMIVSDVGSAVLISELAESFGLSLGRTNYLGRSLSNWMCS